MAKQEEAPVTDMVQSIFDKAMSDPDAIPVVSKYIRTGKRWDITHKDLNGKLIIIKTFKEIKTKYGPAMLVQIDVEGLEKSALFGSTVLFDQIKDLGLNLPVLAVIRKPAKAYTLTDPTSEEIAEYRKLYRS